jgi:protein phosphatase
VVGAAALDRNRPTLGGNSPAARAAQHSASARARADEASPSAGGRPAAEPLEEDDEEPRSRGRRVLAVLGVLVVLAAVAAGGVLGYRWTQEQYYVGVAEDRIAVYQGIPQTVGPLELSSVVETSGTRLEDLPEFMQDRVHQTLPADSLQEARERVADLEDEADRSP